MASVIASHGGAGKEITIREDAPEGLRFAVLKTPRELGWGPSALRDNRLPCVAWPARFRQLERVFEYLERSRTKLATLKRAASQAAKKRNSSSASRP